MTNNLFYSYKYSYVFKKGTYCLCISVDKNTVIKIGALGFLRFPKGSYIYVGSALNGLKARIRRHINTSYNMSENIRWHIDYLLKEPEVSIQSIYVMSSDFKMECSVANAIQKRSEPVKRFGSSDCECKSHLFMVEECGFLTSYGMKNVPKKLIINCNSN